MSNELVSLLKKKFPTGRFTQKRVRRDWSSEETDKLIRIYEEYKGTGNLCREFERQMVGRSLKQCYHKYTSLKRSEEQ